jgi:hypothetical protein
MRSLLSLVFLLIALTTASFSFAQTIPIAAWQRLTCALPWGGSINAGASVVAYLSSSVACLSTCTSQTRTCAGNALTGSYTFNSCSVGACTITVSPPSQSITATKNQPVSGSQSASGGNSPYTWSVIGGAIPPGYSLSSGGSWSGTASTAGSYSATIRATDALGNTGTASYTWNIAQISITPTGQTINISGLGGPVSGSMSASGGTPSYTWSISSGALPPGYNMNSAGVFSGTITTAGTYVATIRARDANNGWSQETFTWNITP